MLHKQQGDVQNIAIKSVCVFVQECGFVTAQIIALYNFPLLCLVTSTHYSASYRVLVSL